jgi:hypothetical protein
MYIGIRAEEPARVRAALHARDDLGDDDVVALYLDTFGDRSRAYALRFNPLGVQQDGVFLEGSGTDLSVDLVLRSVGTLTAEGYELEIAVPFSSLRFPRRAEQVWGLQILRQSRARGEESSWRPLPREHAVRFPLERKFLPFAVCCAFRIRWEAATVGPPAVSLAAEARRVAASERLAADDPAAHGGTLRAGGAAIS